MIGSPMIWPAMGALALAVGLGVQLGESAVHEIDPLYFQGPAARPTAVEPALPAASPYAQAYGWEAGNAARLAESGIDYPYSPTPTPIPAALPMPTPAWQDAPPPPLSLAPWPPGQVVPQPEVERYTDYPIERKPEQSDPAAEEPADGGPAAAEPADKE